MFIKIKVIIIIIMAEDYSYDSKAPFNMAIATLLSLRNTLDKIRDIEGRLDFPPEERQRIKIELVKRFYVDSAPLIMDKEVLKSFEYILKLKPEKVIKVNKTNQKQRLKTIYSYELNEKLDKCLLELQIELQKRKYYMPPREDMGSIVGKMS